MCEILLKSIFRFIIASGYGTLWIVKAMSNQVTYYHLRNAESDSFANCTYYVVVWQLTAQSCWGLWTRLVNTSCSSGRTWRTPCLPRSLVGDDPGERVRPRRPSRTCYLTRVSLEVYLLARSTRLTPSSGRTSCKLCFTSARANAPALIPTSTALCRFGSEITRLTPKR